MIDLMNHMGYDVAIPGNHEFDYGVVAAYLRENLNGVVGEDYADPYGQGRIVAVG